MGSDAIVLLHETNWTVLCLRQQVYGARYVFCRDNEQKDKILRGLGDIKSPRPIFKILRRKR